MMYKLRKPQPPTKNAPKCDSLPTDSFVFRESEPTDIFYIEEDICPADGQPCINITNPISTLLNQKRLDKLNILGDDNVQKWMETIKQNVSAQSELAQLQEKLSADELRTLIRSRRIQSYSELDNYFRYVSSDVDNFNSEIQTYLQQLSVDKKTDDTTE